MAELSEWRSGRRRIVWRVKWFNGNHGAPLNYDRQTKRAALHALRHLRSIGGCNATRNATVKLCKVTIKPKRKL